MRAIHDRYYATPPADFLAYRWRIQLLAEEGVGKASRSGAAREDAAWSKAAEDAGQ